MFKIGYSILFPLIQAKRSTNYYSFDFSEISLKERKRVQYDFFRKFPPTSIVMARQRKCLLFPTIGNETADSSQVTDDKMPKDIYCSL